MSARPLLILGASGFLGAHLAAAARATGARIAVASRTLRGGPRAAWEGCEAHALDALEPGSTERLLTALEPRAVVLAAALSRTDACERDPARARALNAELPGRVSRLCRALGARLVHLSTDLVFGARLPPAGGFREEDPPDPVHEYGRSKAEGEALVLAENPAALVVRLPLLYGDSFGRGLGASDQLLAELARGVRPPLFHDEWRTALEVGNAARAVLELVARDDGGHLHVAGPQRLSRLELGLAVLAARGLTPDEARARVRAVGRAELGLAATRPADVSLDASRARERLRTALLAPAQALA